MSRQITNETVAIAFGTALPFMIVCIGLRRIKKEWFNDLPGILMPSIGISIVGLLAAINSML